MRTLKAVPLLLAACLLLLAGASAAAAPLSDADCKDLFVTANQQLLKANSYHMTFEMAASVPLSGQKAALALAGDFDVQVKPILMKNTMNFSMEAAGKKNEMTIKQYLEETDGKMVSYSFAANKWVKQILPIPVIRQNQAEFLEYCEGVFRDTAVTFARETDDELELEATISADKLREHFEKSLALQGVKDVKLPADLFEDVADLTYTVAIDKKTQLITRISMDMTVFLRSVGEKVLAAAQMPEDKKAPFREILAGGNVQINVGISRVNAVPAIVIPKEARNAPLAPEPPAKKPSPPAASGAVVKIGLNLEMTGAQAVFGQRALEGVRLAAGEINDAGGLFGRQIELVVRNNAGLATEAARASAALINEDKVVAIVGCITSTNTLGAALTAERYRIPLLTPSATNPRVTVPQQGQRREYVFRAAFIDPYQGKVMSRFAADSLNAKTAAILTDASSEYSKQLAREFADHFAAMGGTVIAREIYYQKDANYSVQLMRIHNLNPDVLFVPGYYQEVGLIIRQAREMGITVPILGADGWDSPKIVGIAGPDALKNTYFSNHFTPQDQAPVPKKFVAAYSKKYGKQPDALAALGYDAVLLLAAAVKKAGSIQPEKIRAALESVEIEGATGKITFDAFHNPDKTAVVMTFHKGQFTLFRRVDPD
jgi:branched-chain amino acid transport system substrate-binding protein